MEFRVLADGILIDNRRSSDSSPLWSRLKKITRSRAPLRDPDLTANVHVGTPEELASYEYVHQAAINALNGVGIFGPWPDAFVISKPLELVEKDKAHKVEEAKKAVSLGRQHGFEFRDAPILNVAERHREAGQYKHGAPVYRRTYVHPYYDKTIAGASNKALRIPQLVREFWDPVFEEQQRLHAAPIIAEYQKRLETALRLSRSNLENPIFTVIERPIIGAAPPPEVKHTYSFDRYFEDFYARRQPLALRGLPVAGAERVMNIRHPSGQRSAEHSERVFHPAKTKIEIIKRMVATGHSFEDRQKLGADIVTARKTLQALQQMKGRATSRAYRRTTVQIAQKKLQGLLGQQARIQEIVSTSKKVPNTHISSEPKCETGLFLVINSYNSVPENGTLLQVAHRFAVLLGGYLARNMKLNPDIYHASPLPKPHLLRLDHVTKERRIDEKRVCCPSEKKFFTEGSTGSNSLGATGKWLKDYVGEHAGVSTDAVVVIINSGANAGDSDLYVQHIDELCHTANKVICLQVADHKDGKLSPLEEKLDKLGAKHTNFTLCIADDVMAVRAAFNKAFPQTPAPIERHNKKPLKPLVAGDGSNSEKHALGLHMAPK